MDNLEECQKKYFVSPFINKFREYKGCVLSQAFEKIQDKIYNMEVREEDVWVISFPKTGTTWTQEMVWMIVNDLNFEEALNKDINERSPFVERSALFDRELLLKKIPELSKDMVNINQDSFDVLKNKMNEESCIVIKTHLPWQLLPKQIQEGTKKPKIIYVARNPKDTCVSYYRHSQRYFGYSGDFETFCDLFLAGKMFHAPFWLNVLPFYDRKEPNILFITYEEMIRDIRSVIRKVAVFLGKPINDIQVEKLVDHVSFDKMKNNPSVNKSKSVPEALKQYQFTNESFIRDGKTGSFKEIMSAEMISKFDEWIRENTEAIGLTF